MIRRDRFGRRVYIGPAHYACAALALIVGAVLVVSLAFYS